MDNQKITTERVITFIGILAGVILLVGLSVKGIAYLFPSEQTKALSKLPWETESEFTFGNNENNVKPDGEAFHFANKKQKLTVEEIKFEQQKQAQQKAAAQKKAQEIAKQKAKSKTTSKSTVTTTTQKPTTKKPPTSSSSNQRSPSRSTPTQQRPEPDRPDPPPRSSPTISQSFPGRQHFREGQSNKYVTQLGHLLVNAGYGRYYSVGPGPEFTSADKRNTQAFQKSQGWTGSDADGYPGPETWKRLVDRWNRNH